MRTILAVLGGLVLLAFVLGQCGVPVPGLRQPVVVSDARVAQLQRERDEARTRATQLEQQAAAPAQAAQPAQPVQTHWGRLESLHPHRGSMEEWLRAAGFTWDSIRHDARQPLQDDSPPPRSTRYVSGYIVDGRNIVVNWPNIVTTDRPERITKRDDTVQYMPDPKDPSVLYTNVVANGPVTVYASGYNWGQFTSRLGGAQ